MKSGNGVIKLVIAGEFQMIFGRITPNCTRLIVSAWDRIMWIASIQAQVWNYTGPYGFGDMDMLGSHSSYKTDCRGWKWQVIVGRAKDTF